MTSYDDVNEIVSDVQVGEMEVLVPMQQGIQITAGEGDTRKLKFRLRELSTRTKWDVSSATAATLSLRAALGEALTPIALNLSDPDNDLVNGLICVSVTPSNLTDALGSYMFALVIEIGGEVITAVMGDIEVVDRPGYTPSS